MNHRCQPMNVIDVNIAYIPYVLDSTQILEIFHLQMICSIQQIWYVEIVDIVAGQNVWIRFTNEIRPSFQQIL